MQTQIEITDTVFASHHHSSTTCYIASLQSHVRSCSSDHDIHDLPVSLDKRRKFTLLLLCLPCFPLRDKMKCVLLAWNKREASCNFHDMMRMAWCRETIFRAGQRSRSLKKHCLFKLMLRTSTKLKNSHNTQTHPSPLQVFLWLNCLEFYLATIKNGIWERSEETFSSSVFWNRLIFRLLSHSMLITTVTSELCFSGKEDECRWEAQACHPFALLLWYGHKAKFLHGWLGASCGLFQPWSAANGSPWILWLCEGWDHAGVTAGCRSWWCWQRLALLAPLDWVSQHALGQGVAVALQWLTGQPAALELLFFFLWLKNLCRLKGAPPVLKRQWK